MVIPGFDGMLSYRIRTPFQFQFQGSAMKTKDSSIINKRSQASVLLLALCVSASSAAWAGRPLGTDDAGTTPQGSCQLEAWHEASDASSHTLVLAPACGLTETVELGADYSLPHPQTDVRAAAGLALKWVPARWQMDTGAGALNFGLKFSMGRAQPAAAEWQATESAVLILASLTLNDAWSLHANLGPAHDHGSETRANRFNLALSWVPHTRWQLFAETQTNDRREIFGETVNAAGVRWWWIQDRLGLDLTRSQAAGAEIGWSAGFGWYGIGL